MHDRAPIRELHSDGAPIRAIARDLGIARNTVRAALDPSRPDVYARRSQLDDVEPAIREVLQRYPLMPAAGIARRLGWRGSMTTFQERVRAVRATDEEAVA